MRFSLPFIAAVSCASAAVLQSQSPLVDAVHEDPAISEYDSKPLISTEALQDLIKEKNLRRRAEELYKAAEEGIEEYNHPTRVIGSKGHLATLDYIYKTIADLGDYYDLGTQSFSAVLSNIFAYRLVLGDKQPGSTLAFSITPPTAGKDAVFGPLVLVDNDGCDASDYSSAVNRSIALIKRGDCAFGIKSALAGRAGAIAAVVWNYEDDELSGSLGTPSKDHVATFGIALSDAEPLIKRLKAGDVIASSAYMDAIVSDANTTNIVAQTRGGDQDNCVMLGGHSDSVPPGPGINDDGSGTLTLLEVATQLTNFKVNNCVRFAWWSGEEEGLLGSEYYVSQLSEQQNLKIRLFMDYDMMASPNYAYQVYEATNAANPVGSEELRNLYTDWYDSHGLNSTFVPFDGRSDYVGFITHGIPGGGIATGAEGVKTEEEVLMFGGVAGHWYDPCYHQLCDDLDNLAYDAWVVNTKLVAHSVATYARSLEGFPERTSVKSAAVEQTMPYRGSKLVI